MKITPEHPYLCSTWRAPKALQPAALNFLEAANESGEGALFDQEPRWLALPQTPSLALFVAEWQSPTHF